MLPMLCIGGFYMKVGAVNWRCQMPELFPINRMGKSEPRSKMAEARRRKAKPNLLILLKALLILLKALLGFVLTFLCTPAYISFK